MALPSIKDTIVAIATPKGHGAIGVVRLSGEHAFEVAAKLWRGKPLEGMASQTFAHGRLVWEGDTIDDALMLVFRGRKSYTGQNSVEFHVHGSAAVLSKTMACLQLAGARVAGPGEFTLRAYLAGKMDLAQAESVLSLIEAEGEAARKQALRGLSRALSNTIEQLSLRLLTLLSNIQAWLDYPEEGVETTETSSTIQGVMADIAQLLSTAKVGNMATKGARLALIGEPNAGKSSLLNALLGYERAIVAPIAGTTRDYLEAPLSIAGIPIVAIDTAGLRDTDDLIERSGVERSRQIAQEADLTLFLADSTQPLPTDIPAGAMLVATKADLPALWQRSDFISVSSSTGQGLNTLKERISQRLLGDALEGEVWITNERHQHALEEAYQHLAEALYATDDAMAWSLGAALDALAQITGKDISEEVVDRVFRNFCVGK